MHFYILKVVFTKTKINVSKSKEKKKKTGLKIKWNKKTKQQRYVKTMDGSGKIYRDF